MMRYAKEGVGETIADVIGSIGTITLERYDDQTMLANYGHVPATLKTPSEILGKIAQVKADIAGVGGREGLYLQGMVGAFETFARILDGEEIAYKDAIASMQQVELRPVPQARFDEYKAKVGEALGQMGYQGGLGQQLSAWLKDTAIAPEEVTQTARQFLGRAKQAALERVVQLPLDDDIESVNSIREVFWSGYSRYLGDFHGDLTFNIDRPWSLPTFANTLCHEGYPGHQAFYCHWDHLYRQGLLPLEAAYYSTAGNPANPMFEGSPETGLHFLGWDDLEEDTPEIPDEQKRLFALGRQVQDLQRMYQTQACYLHNVEGASREDVVEFMLSDGIYTEIEAQNTFRFFSHPVQRYYYPSYYYGRWMIYEGYEATPKALRPQFFRLLYDRPHTNQTFIQEVGELIGQPFDPLAKW